MNPVLRVCVSENTRQTAHRTAQRHRPVAAPNDEFALLAKAALLRAAGHLVPDRRAPPNPPGPLQRVGDGRILPPVDKQANWRAGLAGFSRVAEPLGHPMRPAALVEIVAVEVRQRVLLGHATVLLTRRPILFVRFPTARCIRRIGDQRIETFGLKRPD